MGRWSLAVQHIRDLVRPRVADDTADACLLQRFVEQREEAAFTALVERHGPMVLGVCRRILRDPHAAEDAFQATFLVLVRKAGGVGDPSRLANWLYGVALRVAMKARGEGARRAQREKAMIELETAVEPGWDDLRPVLDAEVGRLPAKYRLPVVLCYFEGKSNEEAAASLNWPTGTVKCRLARAREMLRDRIARRSVSLSLGGLTTLLASEATPAALPGTLLRSTTHAALLVQSGAAAGAFSSHITALADEVSQSMSTNHGLRIAAVSLLALSLLGASVASMTLTSADPVAPRNVDPVVKEPGAVRPKPEPIKLAKPCRLELDGYVESIAYSPDQTTLYTVAGGQLQAWDTRSWKQRPLAIKANMVNSVAFSPDGKYLALGLESSVVQLLDVSSGRLIHEFTDALVAPVKGELRGGGISSVAFSPDGRTLASQGYALEDFNLSPEPGPAGPVRLVPTAVNLWDVQSGKHKGRLKELAGHRLAITNTRVLVSTGDGIASFPLAGGDQATTIALSDREKGRWTVGGFGVSPDGRTVALGSASGYISLLDSETGKERHRFRGDLGPIRAIAFSPDGTVLAWSCAWDCKVARVEHLCGNHRIDVSGMGGPTVAQAVEVKVVAFVLGPQFVWQRPEIQQWQVHNHKGRVTAIAITPDARLVATAGQDGKVKLWRWPVEEKLTQELEMKGKALSLGFSLDGKILTASYAGGVKQSWEVSSGSELPAK